MVEEKASTHHKDFLCKKLFSVDQFPNLCHRDLGGLPKASINDACKSLCCRIEAIFATSGSAMHQA